MRMRDVLWQIWLNCGYFLTVAASGFFGYFGFLKGHAHKNPNYIIYY